MHRREGGSWRQRVGEGIRSGNRESALGHSEEPRPTCNRNKEALRGFEKEMTQWRLLLGSSLWWHCTAGLEGRAHPGDRRGTRGSSTRRALAAKSSRNEAERPGAGLAELGTNWISQIRERAELGHPSFWII